MYYKIMVIFPCVVQYILVAYSFYTEQFASLNPLFALAPSHLSSYW